MQPAQILESLRSVRSTRLVELPDTRGLYALRDHEGKIRYIGETCSARMGFRKRLWGYHTTGTETHSHKFSQAYNVGRFWRDPKAHRECPSARLVKGLRTLFIREHCSANIYDLGDICSSEVKILESAVKALAEPTELSWDRQNWVPDAEPTQAIDGFLDHFAATPEQRAAMSVQFERWKSAGATK